MSYFVVARFVPGSSKKEDITFEKPLKIRIERPLTVDMTDVKVKLYEMDTWIYNSKWQYEYWDKKSQEWDLLAEFSGEINGENNKKKFVPSNSSIPEITKKEDCKKFKYAPIIPFTFEGHNKVYRLDLDKGQSVKEFEGDYWELGLEITGKYKGKTYSYKTLYISLVKETANTSYLDNKGEFKSDKSDISKKLKDEGKVHGSYIMMLKRHLAILGFYRCEKSVTSFNYWNYKKNDGSLPNFGNWHIDDAWNDELTRALQHFQIAAIQEWRINASTGKYEKLSKITFDKDNDDVEKEIKDIRAGDKTKAEIILWLGTNYNQVNGNPKQPVYRNPFMYSFCNAYDIFYNTYYSEVYCEYDMKSGRIVNTKCELQTGKAAKYHEKTSFVCTTAVNWFFSHLVCMGRNFKFAAGGSVVDAVLGYATPTYYNDTVRNSLGITGITVEPAFLLPWMDERDPERKNQTMNFLNLHKYVLGINPAPVRQFNVVNEIAQEGPLAGSDVTIRYLPKGAALNTWFVASSRGMTFKTLAKSASSFSPSNWTPTGNIRLSAITNNDGYTIYKVEFQQAGDTNITNNNKLLVSYTAYDKFCETRGMKTFTSINDRYSCKCGLHKSYREITDAFNANKNVFKNWNIATQCDRAGLEHSTLTIHKNDNELYALHGDGMTRFVKFEDEAKVWFEMTGKRLHYLIFNVLNDSELTKINPLFYFNPDTDSLKKMKLKLNYKPEVKNKARA